MHFIRHKQQNFLFPTTFRPAVLFSVYMKFLPPEAHWLMYEADRLHPASAEINNMWSCTSTLHTPVWLKYG